MTQQPVAYREFLEDISNAMLAELTAEYGPWLEAQGLPQWSADELVLSENISDAQRRWLSDFILRWEACCTYYAHDGVHIRAFED